jgi:cellulose synthase/poly-beta-1,6-N-acetylglucosamine synthase-like glycosyltransferase
MTAPRISVVVRSYERIPILLESLTAFLQQDHDAFEIIVIEQTVAPPADDVKALAVLEADPRLRVLRYPPLGAPAARNRGIEAARAPLVACFDDDDLPGGPQFLKELEAHFADPAIAGVTCRHVWRIGEAMPYVSRRLARRRVLSHSTMLLPYTFARFDEDVTTVAWLHGTGSAIRRSVALEVGLWDEDVFQHEEQGFAFRFAAWAKGRDQHLVFRATPVVQRRLDVPGGMARREQGVEHDIAGQARFQHRILGRYHARRYRALRPLYRLLTFVRALGWIWAGIRTQGVMKRCGESIALLWRFWRVDSQHRR